MTTLEELAAHRNAAQKALVKAAWNCIVDASSMNVVLSGPEFNAALRAFREAVAAEAVAALDPERERLRAAAEAVACCSWRRLDGDDLAPMMELRRILEAHDATLGTEP